MQTAVQEISTATIPLIGPTRKNRRLYTANDLFTLIDDSNRYELIKGELIIMPPPGGQHGKLALELGSSILSYVKRHGLGYAFGAETGFLLEVNPDMVRGPDASFVRIERIPDGNIPAGYILDAPDLAVEIVSPSDRAVKVEEKVQCWLEHGSRLVWVVEPKKKTVTIHRSDGTSDTFESGDLLDGEDVLPGFEYELSELF